MSSWMPVFLVFQAKRVHHASHPNEKSPASKTEVSGTDVLQRIGTAIQQDDGGYLIDLVALPVNGKLLMKPPTEHDHRDPTYQGGR